jgi:hypothetical protein
MVKIHIGKLIQAKMKEERRSAAWMAERLNGHRSNIYKIYESTAIDTALLHRISQILEYDFFKHYSEEFVSESKLKR